MDRFPTFPLSQVPDLAGRPGPQSPMNFFRNLKLANKLLVSFVLILLISAVSGLYGLVQMERVNATATD